MRVKVRRVVCVTSGTVAWHQTTVSQAWRMERCDVGGRELLSGRKLSKRKERARQEGRTAGWREKKLGGGEKERGETGERRKKRKKKKKKRKKRKMAKSKKQKESTKK